MIGIKPNSIAAHIIGWLIFLSLPVTFLISRSGPDGGPSFTAWPLYCLFFLIYASIFYLHTYILFPKLYLRKKYVVYFLTILLLLAGIFFLKPYDRTPGHIGSPPGNQEMSNNVLPLPPPGNFQPPGNNSRVAPFVDIISIALFVLVIATS